MCVCIKTLRHVTLGNWSCRWSKKNGKQQAGRRANLRSELQINHRTRQSAAGVWASESMKGRTIAVLPAGALVWALFHNGQNGELIVPHSAPSKGCVGAPVRASPSSEAASLPTSTADTFAESGQSMLGTNINWVLNYSITKRSKVVMQ